jgi:hypothetical protein
VDFELRSAQREKKFIGNDHVGEPRHASIAIRASSSSSPTKSAAN